MRPVSRPLTARSAVAALPLRPGWPAIPVLAAAAALMVAAGLIAAGPAAAQTQLERAVVASGGGAAASSGRSVVATLGQPAVGPASDGTLTLDAGFWIPGFGTVTGLSEPLPAPVFALLPSAPNPFNPRTTLRFELPDRTHATLDIHDLRGRRVDRLVSGTLPAGRHVVIWDGTDAVGRPLPSGTYVARLVSAAGVQTRKMLLTR